MSDQTAAGVPVDAPAWPSWARLTTADGILFAVLTALFVLMELGGTTAGRLFDPLIGPVPQGQSTAGVDVRDGVVAILLAGIFVMNVMALRLLPFRWQVAVVWLELLLMFVVFVAAFDRDLFGVWFSTNRQGDVRVAFMITQGAFTTLYVSLISIAFACVLALAAALGRLSKSGPAYAIATFYISFFRGTPLLLQVFLIYQGLPTLGPAFALDAVPSGIIALSLCYGAYMAEIFRAGIQGVPPGQHEAAAALGLRPGLTFRKIVFPQAMKLIVPPTGNQFIAMLKDSSLVSVMGVWELTKTAQLLGKRDFTVFEMLIAAAIVYWAMSIVFELIQSRIEAHYARDQKR